MRNLALVIASVLVSTAASAHPGHGDAGVTGLSHYVLEPVHILAGLAVVLAAVVGTRALRRRRPTAPGSF